MRLSRRFLVAALVALVVATTACTAILGDFTLSGGGDDTPFDGATTDATGTDGSKGSDASSPTDSGVDSGPQRFCDTQTAPPDASDFHCADFDETNFEQGFVDASVTDGGGALTQDPSAFFSSPNSAFTSITSTNGAMAYLYWQRGGPNVVNHITLSAAIKEDFAETLNTNGVIELLTLNIGPAASEYVVAFVYAFDQANATAGGTFTGYALMILLPAQSPSFYPTGVLSQAGGFTNVKLDYDGVMHRAQVFYDGTNVSLQNYASLSGNLSVQALVGGNSVNIGATELQGQWNIDNAIFTASP